MPEFDIVDLSDSEDKDVDARLYPTDMAQDICERLWPEWREMFLRKNSGYGDTHGELGLRGCFPDVWRKVFRLKAALWEGADTSRWSEQPREIMLDMIGHMFMIVHLLDKETTEVYARYNQTPPEFTLKRGAGPVTMKVRYDDWEAMPEGLQEAVRDLATFLGQRDHEQEVGRGY